MREERKESRDRDVKCKKGKGKNEKNRGFATYVETRKDRSVDWNVRKIYSSLDTHSRADRSRSPQHLPEGCIVMHRSLLTALSLQAENAQWRIRRGAS